MKDEDVALTMISSEVDVPQLKQRLADLDQRIDILQREAEKIRSKLAQEMSKHRPHGTTPGEVIRRGRPSWEDRVLDGMIEP
jgi:uncharacterized small protein (DUF1192 family)